MMPARFFSFGPGRALLSRWKRKCPASVESTGQEASGTSVAPNIIDRLAEDNAIRTEAFHGCAHGRPLGMAALEKEQL